jgi:hypothetical protein
MTGQRGTAAALAAAVLLLLAGCTAGHPVTKISQPVTSHHRVASRHLLASTPVPAGKGTVAAFIAKLQAHAATPFEAKYLFGAGKVPATIVYAVRPPDGLLFAESPMSGKNRTQIVVNGSGEYRCIRPVGQAQWVCQRLSEASAATQNKTFAIYTAAYWASYLKQVARGAMAKITTFTMPPNAPPWIRERIRDAAMNCIGFRAAKSGISTVCAAAPGILGSVLLCRGHSFPMEWYKTSPPASLFRLPPGARVIGLKGGQQPRAA